MPLDPRVKRFLDALAAGRPPNALDTSIEDRRRGLADLMRLSGPEIPMDRVELLSVPGASGHLPARLYVPSGIGTAAPGLIYFHGGGLVAGSLDTHDPVARALAQACNCRVVSVGYRLAPEHPFPAALDDALAASTFIARHAPNFDIDPVRLGICGDSGGATLAAATCQAAAQFAAPRFAVQLLICPILDYSRRSDSRCEFAAGYLVGEDTLAHDLRHYLPVGMDPADPRISPLRAPSFTDLPRTVIHTAEFDPLRDEGRDYFNELTRARVEVSYTCHPGMIHLFYGLGGVIPYARIAYERIGSDMRAAFA